MDRCSRPNARATARRGKGGRSSPRVCGVGGGCGAGLSRPRGRARDAEANVAREGHRPGGRKSRGRRTLYERTRIYVKTPSLQENGKRRRGRRRARLAGLLGLLRAGVGRWASLGQGRCWADSGQVRKVGFFSFFLFPFLFFLFKPILFSLSFLDSNFKNHFEKLRSRRTPIWY